MWCINHYATSPLMYSRQDSNLQHLAPKASTLPIVLLLYKAESSVIETHTLQYTQFSRLALLPNRFTLHFEEDKRLELLHHCYMTTGGFQDHCLTNQAQSSICHLHHCAQWTSVRIKLTMRELNPNLHIDSVICKPLHYMDNIIVLGRRFELLFPE